MQVGEIVFEKSRKNLKKIYNRINSTNLNQHVKAVSDDVLFLAMGGYNRTYELMRAMGLDKEEIVTFSNLNLTANFLMETHQKKLIIIQKINYTTSVNKNTSFVLKKLDLNVADSFEEGMLVYKNAERNIGPSLNKRIAWEKPRIVVLDDPSLNLQYEGHRFRYQNEIGFVQIRNPHTNPKDIIAELEGVEEADRMMFALYQSNVSTESEIVDALKRLSGSVQLQVEEDWYMKPTQFKQVVGSQELAATLKETSELGIHQLQNNKKIGKENARWIVIPAAAFTFSGFNYMDESDLFAKELEKEAEAENRYAMEQEALAQSITAMPIALNMKIGYAGNKMVSSESESLDNFLMEIDDIEREQVHGIELLEGATTEDEYNYIKKNNLAYFLDGHYKNDERNDDNYQGGKRLISIDIDDGDYTRSDIEKKLGSQDLFGLVYRTAKYYFNGANRWRIVMMGDKEMTKEEYKQVVEGIAAMLDLEIDNASKKLSQLMGYPLSSEDVSTVIGGMVNVSQFIKTSRQPLISRPANVVEFQTSTKSLLDFNHEQARIVREIVTTGLRKGERNEKYRQAYMFLRDTLNNPELQAWHKEAMELIEITKSQAVSDGLPAKEVEVIYR